MSVIDRIRERRAAATPMAYQVVADSWQSYSVQDGKGYCLADKLLYEDACFLAYSWEDIGILLAIVAKAEEMREEAGLARTYLGGHIDWLQANDRSHQTTAARRRHDRLHAAVTAFDAAVKGEGK